MTRTRDEPSFEPGDYVYSRDGDEGEVVVCSFAAKSEGVVHWNFLVDWREVGLSYGGPVEGIVRVVKRKDRSGRSPEAGQ